MHLHSSGERSSAMFSGSEAKNSKESARSERENLSLDTAVGSPTSPALALRVPNSPSLQGPLREFQEENTGNPFKLWFERIRTETTVRT